MGTPEFAVPALRAVAAACEVSAVVTRPDRPRGRGQAVAASAVSEAARELALPVMKPERASDAATREALAATRPDLFAVVAFGEILSAELLRLPRLGCINLHGSLLPDYRGASPVQRALWDGRSGTGVTTLWMDEGIDTGDIILQHWAAIEPGDDAGTLGARLAHRGGSLLARTLLLAHQGRAPRLRQELEAGSYARKLAKQDGVVDWSLDVETVWHRQRAVTPWPGATTALRGRPLLLTGTCPEHRLQVPEVPGTIVAVEKDGVVVACRPGALRLQRVKAEGRNELDAADWARGARVQPGDHLGIEREANA